MKNLFSERNGYIKPDDVLITERLTPEIINGICTCYDDLERDLDVTQYQYKDLELYLWTYVLHERKDDFYSHNGFGRPSYAIVATEYIEDKVPWYKKLDLIEATIKHLYKVADNSSYSLDIINLTNRFVSQLNYFFEDLNFGYRVIDQEIVPVTSDGEIKTIAEAVQNSEDNVRSHLHCALEKLAERPKGDYRNSIKESISAVEAYCRNKTGKDSLRNALSEMENNGLRLLPSLKFAFLTIYGYTNSKDTGIRHPLMDTTSEYVPTADEAVYMLVTCSAFINYLKKKESK